MGLGGRFEKTILSRQNRTRLTAVIALAEAVPVGAQTQEWAVPRWLLLGDGDHVVVGYAVY